MSDWKPNEKLLKDKDGVADTLVRCLFENDLEAFRDVLRAHLRMVSKTQLARETKLGRQTLYDLIEKPDFNPTIRTLGPIFKALKAA